MGRNRLVMNCCLWVIVVVFGVVSTVVVSSELLVDGYWGTVLKS